MELSIIKDYEYEHWIANYPQRNFLQSRYEGKKMSQNGGHVYYMAGKENNTIQICALLCLRPLMKRFTYAYLPRGPIYDWTHPEYLSAFYTQLKPFLKQKKCIFLETDPYIPLRQRDKDGHIVDHGWNHFDIVQQYKDMHFQQLPWKQGYDESKQCRWMSVLDLRQKTKEEVFASFSAKTRQNIRKAMKNTIKVRPLSREELPILYNMVKETGERRNFSTLPLSYYQEQYDCFQDHAQAYYAYLDLDAYLTSLYQSMEKEKSTIQQAQDGLRLNPYSKNSKHRLQKAQANLQALDVRLKEAKQLVQTHGKELGLAAAMYIFYGQEIIYLASGSNDMFKNFKGPYALQWAIIQEAIDKGYSYYNFYGISGYFEPGQEGYGVFDFKRGFHADVVELIGNYILPISPTLYKLYEIRSKKTS
ncbi:peptidoglycan bridge formation glycyltransferase FemA/FemB family protein [Absicoccus porci]|uniref:peptidoglycan bridge formation glycyltransferase FemA/FemB family protein n=1 Tax=Absicoccus porci TaxID=2486576 RepID=UPI003F8A9111